MTDTQLLPVIWILGSMVVYVLTILFVSPAVLERLQATIRGRSLILVVRLVYYIGVPYAALLTRAIAPVDMGLTGVGGSLLGWTGAEWLHDLGMGLLAGAVTLIPLGLAARQMARAGCPFGVDEHTSSAVVVDGVYAEIHWAFYRTAPLIILENAYVATLIGLGLVGVELLVSLIRNGLGQRPEERQAWLETALLLTLSAVLFVLTRNVWIIILTHIAVAVLLKTWTTHLARRPASFAPVAQEPPVPLHDPDVRPLNERSEA